MRKIIVSIGTLPSDSKDYRSAINIRELFLLYPEVIANKVTCKCDAVTKHIKKHTEDIFIENAISSISDYKCLKDGLLSINENLSKVVVYQPNSFNENEYERLYQRHSRWMDYSPEAAKQIANNYIRSIQILVALIKQDGIEVEVIL